VTPRRFVGGHGIDNLAVAGAAGRVAQAWAEEIPILSFNGVYASYTEAVLELAVGYFAAGISY
jgi:hypothetical protein